MINKRIFLRIAACFLGSVVLASCVYDYYEEEEGNREEMQKPNFTGFSVNIKLTLDHMGGTRAAKASELTTFENYIDPEKCRVLFFDNQDRFLFESKSRWVKQMNGLTGGEQWLVSVPMYAYGNDVEERWRWQQIRRVMMTEEDENGVSFKVAILANRPALEVYPDLEKEVKDDPNAVRVAFTFDNSGPHWTVEDTRFGGTLDSDGNNPNCKTIFNLHHTQEDPIYRDKGMPTSGDFKWAGDNFYDFIAEYQTVKDEAGQSKNVLAMSSTSSWVDYGVNSGDDSPRAATEGNTKRRAARKADTNYPIPMYGVQSFGKIEKWIEGVPFNLSDFTGATDEDHEYGYKNIALLRSVVKLELVVPKTIKVDYCALAYSNIYARCEPMDVWTPTEDLWEKQGHDVSTNCEWFTLKKYARMVEKGTGTGGVAGTGTLENNKGTVGTSLNTDDEYNFNAYRRRLSWFYGAWLEKGWPFNGVYDTNAGTYTNGHSSGREVVQSLIDEQGASPRIFNPCIQRNQYVLVDEENIYDFNDSNNHYVVYTGERNSIDPNYIYAVDAGSGIEPTVIFWLLAINGNVYGLPITEYNGNTVVANQIKKTAAFGTRVKPNNPRWASNNEADPYAGAMVTLGSTLKKENRLTDEETDMLPWPLMRNHCYTVRVGPNTKAAEDGTFELDLSSDVNYSETLELK